MGGGGFVFMKKIFFASVCAMVAAAAFCIFSGIGDGLEY